MNSSFKERLEKLMCDKHKHSLNYFYIFWDNGIKERAFCNQCEKPKGSMNVDQLLQAYGQLVLQNNQNEPRLKGFREEFNSQLNILQLMIKKLYEDFEQLIKMKSKITLLTEFDELIYDHQLNKTSLNKILQNISQFIKGKEQEKYIFIQEEVSDQNIAIVQELCQRLREITQFSQKCSLMNAQNQNKLINNHQINNKPYFLQREIKSNFQSIKSLQFNYDSTKLLTRGDHRQIALEVWNQQGNQFNLSTSLNCHKFGILHLCVSRQQALYFTVGMDDKSKDKNKAYTYSIKIWNPKIELVTRIHCIIHQTLHHIGCIVLSNQEQYLAIGEGPSIKIFFKNQENQYIALSTPNQQKEFVKCLAFDEFDQIIFCGTEDSDILIYKFEEQKLSLTQKLQAGYIPQQLIYINDCSLLSLNRDGIVQIFKNDGKQLDFKCIQTISEYNVKIRSIAINSNQLEIALGWENNQIEFMRLIQGKWEMKSRQKLQSSVEVLCFSHIYNVLAVAVESKILIYQQQQ